MDVKERNIFARYFYVNYDDYYYVSPLPGEKEGISASSIGGFNMIINEFISEEKKIAAGKIIDYLLSKEIQKKYAIKFNKRSAMDELYYDEDLCNKINCEFEKSMQLVARPTHLLSDYDKYSLKFRTYLYDFLYNNATVKDTIQKINDIAIINTISYSSSIGIVIIVISSIIMIVILLSYGIILQKRNHFYLRMYNKSSWFIMLLGLCILISYNITLLGELNVFKCTFHLLLPTIGISFFAYPTFIHEIINFPELNKYSEFIKRNNKIVIIGLMVTDIIYGVLFHYISPLQIKPIYVDGGKNFNTCIIKSNNHLVFLIIMYVFKFILWFITTILNFIEYNIKIISSEMKTISVILYCNTFLIYTN